MQRLVHQEQEVCKGLGDTFFRHPRPTATEEQGARGTHLRKRNKDAADSFMVIVPGVCVEIGIARRDVSIYQKKKLWLCFGFEYLVCTST